MQTPMMSTSVDQDYQSVVGNKVWPSTARDWSGMQCEEGMLSTLLSSQFSPALAIKQMLLSGSL